MATLLLRVDGLGPEDPPRLERLLREMAGVFGVVVSGAEGCAELDIEDDEVSVDRILERVERAGWTARISG